MTEVESETLWQIGKPDDAGKEFVQAGGWKAEFNYTVGSDEDPINQPSIPATLVATEHKPKPKRYSTDKLNIRFTLDRNYDDGELTLFYDFFGSQIDTILLDSEKLIEIQGVGKGKIKQNQIPLTALGSGEHELTITTAKSKNQNAHMIDYLKLVSAIAVSQVEQPPMTTTTIEKQNSEQEKDSQETIFTSNTPETEITTTDKQKSQEKDSEETISSLEKKSSSTTKKTQKTTTIDKQKSQQEDTQETISSSSTPESPQTTTEEAQEAISSSEKKSIPSTKKTQKITETKETMPSSQKKSSSTTKKTPPAPTTHIPVAHPTTSRSGGGIEDYYYWVKTVAQEKAAKAGSEKKSFRRGRIWV